MAESCGLRSSDMSWFRRTVLKGRGLISFLMSPMEILSVLFRFWLFLLLFVYEFVMTVFTPKPSKHEGVGMGNADLKQGGARKRILSQRYGDTPRKMMLYLYTNVPNDITTHILNDTLEDMFNLEMYREDTTTNDDVVLVYYDAVSRHDVDIKTALNGSPGRPDRKLLVMFVNQPYISNYTHPENERGNMDAGYIAWLAYSRQSGRFWDTKDNNENLKRIREFLSQLKSNIKSL